MERYRKVTPAEKFWVGLGVYVLAADIILWRRDCDTMSVCFGKWLLTPRGKAACMVGTAGLVAHLFVGMPLPAQSLMRKHLGGKKDCRTKPGSMSSMVDLTTSK